MDGYNGLIALVNLNTQSVEPIYFDEEIAKKFIGGTGLGTYFLMKYSSPEVDPLSPDNPLIYMTGPFTGTVIPSSVSHHIITKSFVTGTCGSSAVGGTFGVKLKKAGFDGLIIVGKADKPVYLSICNNEILFKDASGLWGLNYKDAAQIIQKELTSAGTILGIGLAGERLNPKAEIYHDGIVSPTASGDGIGAILGSKQLKVIVVTGSGTVSIADQNALNELIDKRLKNMSEMKTNLPEFKDPVSAVASVAVQFGWNDKSADLSKEVLLAKLQDLLEIADSLIIGKEILHSGTSSITDLLSCLKFITGWDLTLEKFLKVGERIFTLKRMYNIAQDVGFSRDPLFETVKSESPATGLSTGDLPDLGFQLQEYYGYRGWLENGIPSVEKIEELGLEEFLSWHRCQEILA